MNLLNRLLEPDQGKRPSAAEALRHKWFEGTSLINNLIEFN
jgi:serine/threonine protein kinase